MTPTTHPPQPSAPLRCVTLDVPFRDRMRVAQELTDVAKATEVRVRLSDNVVVNAQGMAEPADGLARLEAYFPVSP